MANPNPANKFPKGKSGNLKGRPKLDGLIKKVRKEARPEVIDQMWTVWNAPEDELKRYVAGKQIGSGFRFLARAMQKAIMTGDWRYIGPILDRLIGPVKAKVSVDGGEDGEPIGIQSLSDSELKARIKQLLVTTGFNKILADGEEK